MRRTPRASRSLFAPPRRAAGQDSAGRRDDNAGPPRPQATPGPTAPPGDDRRPAPDRLAGSRHPDGRPDQPGAPGRPGAAPPNPATPAPPAVPAESEREAALARLFELHYTSMLRLAALLGADDPENIVAEAYYELYRRWRRLRDADRAESYLRSVVCNLTRMRLRHLRIVRKHAAGPPAEWAASAEYTALLHDDQRALVRALRTLPPRQREALVLRHWLGLKEAEIAEAMGISAGSVKTHTARGIAALTRVLQDRR
jgi:RNA polymerase sigma-70 factor (sigma-E family)